MSILPFLLYAIDLEQAQDIDRVFTITNTYGNLPTMKFPVKNSGSGFKGGAKNKKQIKSRKANKLARKARKLK